MSLYPRHLSSIQRARRSGALLYGTVALIAVGFAESRLLSIPEIGAWIIAFYGAVIVTVVAVARALSEQYLRMRSTLFGVPPVVAVPIYSFGTGFITPIVLFSVVRDFGFTYYLIITAIAASPVLLIGGVAVTALMHWMYSERA